MKHATFIFLDQFKNVILYIPGTFSPPCNFFSCCYSLNIYCAKWAQGLTWQADLMLFGNKKFTRNLAFVHIFQQINSCSVVMKLMLSWQDYPCLSCLFQLKNQFLQKIISIFGVAEWPIQSPDLSPLDFFFLVYLKNNIIEITL